MVLRMRADRMSLMGNPLHQLRIGFRHPADHKERRPYTFSGECIENARRIGAQRTVVESEHHLAITKGESFSILQRADALVLGRIDGQYTARTQGMRIHVACDRVYRHCGADEAGQQEDTFGQRDQISTTRFGISFLSSALRGKCRLSSRPAASMAWIKPSASRSSFAATTICCVSAFHSD